MTTTSLAGAGFGPVTNSPKLDEPWNGQTGGYAALTAVRSAQHEGYDRFVLEFNGPIPGYLVRYGPPSAISIADTEVRVTGSAGLLVNVYGGGTWGVEDGYRPPRTVQSDTAAITEAAFVDDFEAIMRWLIGVDEKRPFRVTTLSGPSRIVIDVEAPLAQ